MFYRSENECRIWLRLCCDSFLQLSNEEKFKTRFMAQKYHVLSALIKLDKFSARNSIDIVW